MTAVAPAARAQGGDRPARPRAPAVRRSGVRWRVQTAGDGPALLLLHGTGSSSDSFRALMPLLAERFTVVAPDLPGHGATEVPPWFEPSLPGCAAALRELLEARAVEPVVAVGHSAGAALAVRLALDGAIDPLLLVGLGAALVPFRGLARTTLPAAARLLSLASAHFAPPRWSAARVDRLVRSTGSALGGADLEHYRRLLERPGHVTATLAMMARWDVAPLFAELPMLATPLLLLAGERDRAVSVDQQRAVAARAPAGRLVVVAQAGHLLHEERPAAVARRIMAEAAALAKEATPRERPGAGAGREAARGPGGDGDGDE